MIEAPYRIFIYSSLLLILFIGGQPAHSQEDTIQFTSEEKSWIAEHRQIKLGFNLDMEPFLIKNGHYSGVIPDLYEQIGALTGLEFLIESGEWPQIIQQATQGNIDGLFMASPPLIKKLGLLQTQGLFDVIPTLYTRASAPFSISEFDDIKDKRVVYLKGTKILQKFLEPYQNTSQIITADSIAEVMKMVAEGKADVALGNNFNTYYLDKYLIIGLQPAFFDLEHKFTVVAGIRSDWPELSRIINKALGHIGKRGVQQVVNRWVSAAPAGKKKIELTPQEKAWLEAHPEVTLGFHSGSQPLLIVDNNGEQSGILVDVYKELENLTGLKVRGVVGQWDEIITKAKLSEIDGLWINAPELARKTGLIQTQFFTRGTPTVYAKATAPFEINSLNDLKGKKIAVLKGRYISKKVLKPYIEEIDVIETNTPLASLKMVIEGKADAAFLLQYQNFLIGQHALVGIEAVYFSEENAANAVTGIRKDWPEFVSIVNKGLNAMGQAKLNAINAKWTLLQSTNKKSSTVVLTQNEQGLLAQKGQINLCVDPSWMPFEQINEQGEYEGLVADYMALVFGRLGISFKLYPTKTFDESLSKLESGQCTILSSWGPTEGAPEPGVASKPYLMLSTVFAVQQDEAFINDIQAFAGRRIGVVRNYPLQYEMERMFPNNKLVLVENEDVGVQMVANGELDTFVSTLSGISHSIQKQSLYNVKIGAVIPEKSPVTMLVNKNEATLVPLLDRAIDSITPEDRKRITAPWMSVRLEQGVNYELAWKVGGGFLLILALILLINRRMSKEITARIKVEQELNTAKDVAEQANAELEIFKKLADSTAQGIGMARLDTKIHYMNEALSKLLTGKSNSSFLKKSFIDYYPEEYQQKMANEVMPELMKNGTWTGELTLINSSNEVIPTIENFYLIRDNKGEPLYVADIITDISEPRRIQDVLRELETSRDLALDAANIGVWTSYLDGFSPEKELTEYSWEGDSRICHHLGLHSDSKIDDIRIWINTIHPEDRDIAAATLKSALKGDNLYDTEYRVLWPDGSVHYLLVRGEVSFGEDGTPQRIDGVMYDLTQLKETENALKTAKETAEAANRAKSQFLANMSHELRTPLNAILGFSQMLAHDSDTNYAQKEKITIINRSGEHLLAMINDVLDLSKIEAGQEEVKPEAFDLPQMLQDIGNMFDVRASKTQLRFNLELDESLVRYIKADLGKLRQIIINLLGNALKFTSMGGFSMRARTMPIVGDPKLVLLQLEIQDSGRGIASDQLEQIFKPFIQTGHSKDDAKGTGLGLSISKSFIDLMGGEISVESTLGKGSLFRIDLTVALAEGLEASRVQITSPEVVGLEPGQTAWRILVVEDNTENRLLLGSLLRHVGFEVQEVENGEEGVLKFEQWQPHFIWMDMRMPVMDGYEATAKIRKLSGGKGVKIVAITASAFKEQYKKILAVGCDEVLHKPFKSHEIYDSMAKHLGVRYLYDETVEIPAALTDQVIDITKAKELAASLPVQLLHDLKDAAIKLDLKASYSLFESVDKVQPELADMLRRCLDEMDFTTIGLVLGHE